MDEAEVSHIVDDKEARSAIIAAAGFYYHARARCMYFFRERLRISNDAMATGSARHDAVMPTPSPTF